MNPLWDHCACFEEFFICPNRKTEVAAVLVTKKINNNVAVWTATGGS